MCVCVCVRVRVRVCAHTHTCSHSCGACIAHTRSIGLKHDDVRDHNKPGARCIAGELRGPAVEADGKQAVPNALAVVY